MRINVDQAAVIFGNVMDAATYRKACDNKNKFVKKFGDDTRSTFHIKAVDAPVIGPRFGTRLVVPADEGEGEFDIYADAASQPVPPKTPRAFEDADGKPVVIGNIRMGYGHYRIAMAMASAAHAMGFTPYWFDLCGFPTTTCSKIIEYQNDLYSKGSRISQKSQLFNSVVWDPLNSEGFRKLSYNSSDQKVSELMVTPYQDLPEDVPFIGTHAWPSQAAVHAGLTNVVNAIPDNWPMALHLAEGSIHTVQTPSAYLGYKMLRGMDKTKILKPMPLGSLAYTGHYVDHEIVSNIDADCDRRENRVATGKPVRYLLTVGGAGAQQDLFRKIISQIMVKVEEGNAVLMINFGDHKDVYESLLHQVPVLYQAINHFDDFDEAARFAEDALDGDIKGAHVFCSSDIFSAVYTTNLLMRCCDMLITKPSELSFYPVPKIMIKHVGGHEAWGAVRAAEVGDGTYELSDSVEMGSFIEAVQAERSLIVDMCDQIRSANEQGIYNGAYNVVGMAATTM